MPVRVLLNRCPELEVLFASEGMRTFLAALAAKGAEKALASLGQGPEVSSPGEPPNTQSGDLAGSITSADNVTQAGSNHAGFLELGTRKMAARPFLLKACLATAPDVEPLAHEHLGI